MLLFFRAVKRELHVIFARAQNGVLSRQGVMQEG